MPERKIVIAVTGASGSIYAKLLLDKLAGFNAQIETGVIFSANARDVWKLELGNEDHSTYPFTYYNKDDFFAPFASGSAQYDTMIICPCSMGTLGRIASGLSNDLTTRAADVILKERRKLILVLRDTPYNLVHINNMKTVTEAGGIICPATPSFYSRPQSVQEVAATVTDRVLDLAGIPSGSYRWGQESS